MKCILHLLSAHLLFLSAAALGANLDKTQFIKISPQDERAVIKAADGKLRVIKPGDVVDEGVTVKEIAAGRIVLEEKIDRGLEKIIVRMVNDRARIERMRKEPENGPILVAPAKSER
jgi:hypothetical protein